MKLCSQCFQDEDDMWKSCVPWFGELWLVNGKGFGHAVAWGVVFWFGFGSNLRGVEKRNELKLSILSGRKTSGNHEENMWNHVCRGLVSSGMWKGKGFRHLVVYSLSFKSAGEDHQQSRGGWGMEPMYIRSVFKMGAYGNHVEFICSVVWWALVYEREGIRAHSGIGFVFWLGCGALGRHVGEFFERAWYALSRARLVLYWKTWRKIWRPSYLHHWGYVCGGRCMGSL